jgi:hypothetical protein
MVAVAVSVAVAVDVTIAVSVAVPVNAFSGCFLWKGPTRAYLSYDDTMDRTKRRATESDLRDSLS